MLHMHARYHGDVDVCLKDVFFCLPLCLVWLRIFVCCGSVISSAVCLHVFSFPISRSLLLFRCYNPSIVRSLFCHPLRLSFLPSSTQYQAPHPSALAPQVMPSPLTLPELLHKILWHLPMQDLLACYLVCHKWRGIIQGSLSLRRRHLLAQQGFRDASDGFRTGDGAWVRRSENGGGVVQSSLEVGAGRGRGWG